MTKSLVQRLEGHSKAEDLATIPREPRAASRISGSSLFSRDTHELEACDGVRLRWSNSCHSWLVHALG